MSQNYDAREIEKLAYDIMRHRKLYYEGTPEIADPDFDKLEEKLRILSPQHPALSAVGSEVTTSGEKVAHKIPMLSLQKVYEESELLKWQDSEEIIGSWKVDGNSLSLVYESGKLVMAKTRGNGRQGENVSEKAGWVSDIVPSVFEEWNFEVRGELYCSEENFATLAKDMISRGLERPTNPRNIVAGILGRKSHFDLARYFSFLAFDLIIEEESEPFRLEEEKFEWLSKKGFSLPGPKKLSTGDETLSYLKSVREMMSSGQIGLDGAVFSYNDLETQRAMGHTSHHPRFKMSFKWQGETAVATINSFTWSTSRNGIVTPVAVIDPVHLSGAKITNITLHNALHIRTYDLNIGDRIEIVRSGEVIPKFLRVLSSKSEGFAWIDRCPSCDAALEFDDVRLLCPNTDFCPAQKIGAILNWIKYAEIDDLSEKRLESMIELGLIEGIVDLYRLSVADLLKLPLTKEKMASKLHANIQNSRKMGLPQLLSGLGILGMGRTSWEKIIEVHPSLDLIRKLTLSDIISIDGFAEKTAEQLVAGIKAKKTLLDELLGFIDPVLDVVQADSIFEGKTFVITGKLNLPRSEISQSIKKYGGKVGSSVSQNTYAIVTASPDSQSTKMEKARKLGIPIWSENKLFDEMGGKD